jgi:hypothetical protein
MWSSSSGFADTKSIETSVANCLQQFTASSAHTFGWSRTTPSFFEDQISLTTAQQLINEP